MEINKKLIQGLADRIETENEKFNSLTNNDKKVVIALDCLIRIEAKQLIPYCGMFINVPMSLKDTNQPIQSQLNTPEMEIQCESCAKGSLFLAYIGRANKFNPSDLENGNHLDDPQHQKLLELFTERELAYIEMAFEGEQFIKEMLLDSEGNKEEIIFAEEELLKAREFYVKYGGQYYGNPKDDTFSIWDNEGCEEETNGRLIAICENIIKNNGEFIL